MFAPARVRIQWLRPQPYHETFSYVRIEQTARVHSAQPAQTNQPHGQSG